MSLVLLDTEILASVWTRYLIADFLSIITKLQHTHTQNNIMDIAEMHCKRKCRSCSLMILSNVQQTV